MLIRDAAPNGRTAAHVLVEALVSNGVDHVFCVPGESYISVLDALADHAARSGVFRLLDPQAFAACFTRFMQRFAEGLQNVVAIDGKTLRRSFDRAAEQSPLHMLHAWSVGQRLLLGQLAVDVKSNESTAVPKLLEMLSLRGCIVTADALNCQRAIAAKVVEQGADYVLALKANQPSLRDDIQRFLNDKQRTPDATHTARSMLTTAVSRRGPALCAPT
jgi:hypothetical protein